MCAPSPSAPLQKVNVGVQLPPLSVRIAVFLHSATLWDGWVRPHLACAYPQLCASSLGMCTPSLGMCAPSPGMCAPSLVRAFTCAHPHLACARPHPACVRPHLACARPLRPPLSKKSMSVSNYPPYPCILLSFCPPLPCGIVGCALTCHVRALTCARPHLACARPHLACARPHLCAPSPGMCEPSLGMCAPSLVRALTWHLHALSVRPSPKSQCRCPTTPLIRAYCCLFALSYLVG